MNYLDQQDLQLHVKIVGWLHIVGSGLLVLIGIFLVILLPGIGVASGDPDAASILPVVGFAICLFLGALATPGLLAGFGLLQRKSWARVLAVVVSVLNLVNIPIGTTIGIYSIWVLMQEAATDYFASAKSA